MFSATEYEYIKGLTENYYINGYTNYLCITNNPTTNYTNNNVYDIICYYSKDILTITNNNMNVSDNSFKCEFDSNNYSENNTIDKLSCNNYSGNVSLNTKEFVYANINNYSNIISDYELKNNYYKNSSLYILSILAIIILIFLYKFVSRIIKG